MRIGLQALWLQAHVADLPLCLCVDIKIFICSEIQLDSLLYGAMTGAILHVGTREVYFFSRCVNSLFPTCLISLLTMTKHHYGKWNLYEGNLISLLLFLVEVFIFQNLINIVYFVIAIKCTYDHQLLLQILTGIVTRWVCHSSKSKMWFIQNEN